MMFSTQPVLCLANWREGAYAYSILRHESLSYFWVLRLPLATMSSEQTEGFTAYLYKDLIAESVEFSSDTFNYVRMDMTRDVERDVKHLCADEYEICSVQLEVSS